LFVFHHAPPKINKSIRSTINPIINNTRATWTCQTYFYHIYKEYLDTNEQAKVLVAQNAAGRCLLGLLPSGGGSYPPPVCMVIDPPATQNRIRVVRNPHDRGITQKAGGFVLEVCQTCKIGGVSQRTIKINFVSFHLHLFVKLNLFVFHHAPPKINKSIRSTINPIINNTRATWTCQTYFYQQAYIYHIYKEYLDTNEQAKVLVAQNIVK